MFGFPRQSRDSCTTRLFLLAHVQTKVPSVLQQIFFILKTVFAGCQYLHNKEKQISQYYFPKIDCFYQEDELVTCIKSCVDVFDQLKNIQTASKRLQNE